MPGVTVWQIEYCAPPGVDQPANWRKLLSLRSFAEANEQVASFQARPHCPPLRLVNEVTGAVIVFP